MKRLIIFLLSIILYTSVIGQQYVVVSVTSLTNIILQPVGGGSTVRTGCVEHSDLWPYVGQIYSAMGGDCYEAPQAAYQNLCFIPGCEINVTTLIGQPTCGQNNGSVSLSVVESGTYEFNFNNQGWSSNNFFNNLPPGQYTVSARNINGSCQSTLYTITLYDEISGLMMTAIPSTCNPVTNTYDVSVVIAGTGFPYGNLSVSLAGQTMNVSSPFPNPVNLTLAIFVIGAVIAVIGGIMYVTIVLTSNLTGPRKVPEGLLLVSGTNNPLLESTKLTDHQMEDKQNQPKGTLCLGRS